ncbi:hypothetical protein Vadar_011113 [Vaccinium darrowii]|uniref:Uncharacterized protein n=1 Tax=Vaccinium darrowii TaxID=229202 RepID=A0ACB7YD75_9ERIC|nr:hypothetical protein Vadar_011113 [Vaccinium darrowii]
MHRADSLSCSKSRQTAHRSQPNSPHPSQYPVMQQHKIIIPNNGGEKLVGTLHETGSVEIVILCHGFPSSKEDDTMVNLAVALEKEGITAFRFDFSGSGESERSSHFGNYRSEAEDLRAVIHHFNGANHIMSAVLGHSKGGDVVLLYASNYHNIPTVVNVSGRYNWGRGIEEHMGTGSEVHMLLPYIPDDPYCKLSFHYVTTMMMVATSYKPVLFVPDSFSKTILVMLNTLRHACQNGLLRSKT